MVATAVRYPSSYDAVIAGAPAVNWIHLHAGRMAINRAVNATPAPALREELYRVYDRGPAMAALRKRAGID